ncbi:ATP-binding protein [Streptomyces sp. NPDC050560]|uniref:ATP-binding protein n=1 Tax=Streptomyces sp. NPDC050560 TaxID=3365630 RepID=UPI00379C2D79
MIPVSRPRTVHSAVPAHPSQASRVRRLVADRLRQWGAPDLLDAAVLATDELFANAVRHAGRGRPVLIMVTVEFCCHELRVSVADPSPVLPRSRDADEGAESGRGLAIVSALADSWGTAPPDPGSVGKKVWFSLSAKDRL